MTVCSNCGAVLPEGSVICPNCGQEVQMISAVDVLEEELLKEIVDEKNLNDDTTETGNGTETETAPTTGTKKKKQNKTRRNLILVIVIAAAAVCVFAGIMYRNTHSETYLLRRAQQEYDQKDYDSSLTFLNQLLGRDPENVDALVLEGEVYAAIPDYASAENCFLTAIQLDPDCAEAYEGILKVYDAQGKQSEIQALRKTVTNPDILALFDAYIIPEPEIKVESGTYTEYFSVEIRAPKKGLTIYYTLNGMTPTSKDTMYTSPIEIDAQGITTLTAVCMDEDGNYSEPVTAVYQVELAKPDMPKASPDGGEFDYERTVTVTVPAGTTVYYSWTNSEPDEDSYRYTGPITIPEGNNVLSLVAIDANGNRSEVLRCNYIFYPQTSPQTYSYSEEDQSQDTDEEEESYESTDDADSYDDEEWYDDTEDNSDEDSNEGEE
ncbi:MAG: chitobiase/beta-hexosaminidase C-terminal domain-containing protein [Lachnospiraceae bacterium]|nr:chitobiase/beta-hexosaminidase C-terminal domain-containing protein [Lachnospiraceae bacterium]